MHGKDCLTIGKKVGSERERNIPGVNISYFNNLVTSEARPDQTVYCFNANEF